jgi:myo-inositol-1(or 4)-monophosphatase
MVDALNTKVAYTSALSGKNALNAASMGEFELQTLTGKVTSLLRTVAEEELMPRFHRVRIERKHDGSVVTDADRAVEARLVRELPTLFDCPVLGEEMPSAEQQVIWRDARWNWCVDPLDGTGNFASGKRYFGISVALMRQRRSVLGFVLDPNHHELYYAAVGRGAYKLDRMGHQHRLKRQPAVSLGEAHLEIGRFKRLGRLQSALRAHAPCRKMSQSGASVLQWCHLAEGRTDVFLHAGEHPWDYAAGALILEEAGGRVASITHDDYWRTHDPQAMWEQSVIAARHPALFDEWKRWVRMHY